MITTASHLNYSFVIRVRPVLNGDVGEIRTCLGEPPPGYLFCNGQAVSKTQYPELWATIGDTYMTVATTGMFNLPNISGRIIVEQEQELLRHIFQELYDEAHRRLKKVQLA